MTYERFVRQLDGCAYCPGGQNCTCACEAMWLYRASQGRIVTSACAVRRRTGDRTGGTNLEQMQHVSSGLGITGGVLYRPTLFAKVRDIVLTGRYGAIIQIGYSQIAGSTWDCFDGEFRGGHALYLSRGTLATGHAADPGADGRRPSIPTGFQNYPWAVLERAASALPLGGGATVGSEFGSGRVYAYVTPADPLPPKAQFIVAIEGTPGEPRTYTNLYVAPNGQKVGAVSVATYVCARSSVSGIWWYRILSKADGSFTKNAGRWFKPNRYTTARLP